jgi:hypothetical protein
MINGLPFYSSFQSTKSSVRCTFRSPLGPLADWVRLGLLSGLSPIRGGVERSAVGVVFPLPGGKEGERGVKEQTSLRRRDEGAPAFPEPE